MQESLTSYKNSSLVEDLFKSTVVRVSNDATSRIEIAYLMIYLLLSNGLVTHLNSFLYDAFYL